MPLYEYLCITSDCEVGGEPVVRISSVADRDAQDCEVCGQPLERVEICETAEPRIDSRFQMKAITSDGKKVAGNFGGGVRTQAPALTTGRSPSREDRRKNLHKAWK